MNSRQSANLLQSAILCRYLWNSDNKLIISLTPGRNGAIKLSALTAHWVIQY